MDAKAQNAFTLCLVSMKVRGKIHKRKKVNETLHLHLFGSLLNGKNRLFYVGSTPMMLSV